jgi:pseudouridine 5'-phosphatase
VFNKVTEKYGKKMTPEVRLKLLGTTEIRSCETCVNDLKLDVSLDQFISDFREMSQKMLGNIDLMPGAERLVRHLHTNNIPICIGTSSGEESVLVKTKKHQEVFKLFHHITKGTDPEVKQGKPAPDIFLIAASRFEPPANPSNVSVSLVFKVRSKSIIITIIISVLSFGGRT